jgi:hypothetical protein
MVKRGDIAKCSQKCIGLITCDEPQQVTYGDGSTGSAWVGVHWHNRPELGILIGDPWSSRNPKVIGHIDQVTSWFSEHLELREAVEIVEQFQEWIESLFDIPNLSNEEIGEIPHASLSWSTTTLCVCVDNNCLWDDQSNLFELTLDNCKREYRRQVQTNWRIARLIPSCDAAKAVEDFAKVAFSAMRPEVDGCFDDDCSYNGD